MAKPLDYGAVDAVEVVGLQLLAGHRGQAVGPRSVGMVSAGHAFVQSLRRGYYEFGLGTDPGHQLPVVFAELVLAI